MSRVSISIIMTQSKDVNYNFEIYKLKENYLPLSVAFL